MSKQAFTLDSGVEVCERCGNGGFMCIYCAAAHGTTEEYSFDVHGSVPEASKDDVAEAMREHFGRTEADRIYDLLYQHFHIAKRVGGVR